MAKSSLTEYCGSLTDDDSGIGIDYKSSSDLNSSTSTFLEPSFSTRTTSPPPITTLQPRYITASLIKVVSDGTIQRIRPSTMKNSENGDFIVCRTIRGTYVARRTPVVPEWIARLVEEIEFEQR